MWKTLIGLLRDMFALNRSVKGHDQQIEKLAGSHEELSAQFYRLTERVLRLELELQHAKEQHAREREHFRLQLENLILRVQRGLPPPEPPKLPAEPSHQPDEQSLDKQEE